MTRPPPTNPIKPIPSSNMEKLSRRLHPQSRYTPCSGSVFCTSSIETERSETKETTSKKSGRGKFRRICQHTGMSANTVAKYIRQLEERQLINVEPTKVRTKSGEVRNGTLQFTIRPIQEAVNYHLERQLAGLPPRKSRKKKR